MKVRCDIDEIEIENDNGHPIPSVAATCRRCGHETESFGNSEVSIRRCLVVMREECPRGERNYHTGGD